MSLHLGDTAPDFTVDSTRGLIRFREWLGESWGMLFSHPADFTPVCTTELGAVARLGPEFVARGVKVIGLSVDSVESHLRWEDDVAKTQGAPVDFPMIADVDRVVSELYHPDPPGCERDRHRPHGLRRRPGQDGAADPDLPDVHRSQLLPEILRAIDSLQLTEAHPVATPADWQPGDDVIIGLSVDDEDAAQRFPHHRVVKPYLRLTASPDVTPVPV